MFGDSPAIFAGGGQRFHQANLPGGHELAELLIPDLGALG
jgi:hypothetical protein